MSDVPPMTADEFYGAKTDVQVDKPPPPPARPDTMSADDFYNAKPADQSGWATWAEPDTDTELEKARRSYPNTEVHSVRTGPTANYAAGINQELARLGGGPVDAAAWLINKGAGALGAEKPVVSHPIGGSESIQDLMGLAGIDPRKVMPMGEDEQVARRAGETTTGMLVPYSAARAVSETAPELVRRAGDLLSAGDRTAPLSIAREVPRVASQVAIGSAAGAAGQIAENQVPAPYKPLANFAGQLAGGAIPAAVETAARAASRLTGNALDRYTAPISLGRESSPAGPSGIPATDRQLDLARDRITTAIGGDQEIPRVSDALSAGDREIVPGSQPTSYQATGNQQLGDLERWSRTRNPDLHLERQNEQDLARDRAVGGLIPENAGNVGAFVQEQLDRIDEGGRAAVEPARANVVAAVDRIGGHDTAQVYGDRIAGDIERNYAPVMGEADRAIDEQGARTGEAVQAIGGRGTEPGPAVQRYGEQLRGNPGTGEEAASGVAGAKQAKKEQVGGLWDAIPKDLQLNSDPLRAAAQRVRGMVDEAAGDEVTGREAALLQRAAEFPRDASFDTARGFRSNLSAAIRDAGQRLGWDSREVRRLMTLKQGVDDAIKATVEGRASEEAAGVASGQMSPEQTIFAKLSAQAQAFREQRAGQAVQAGSRDRTAAAGEPGPGAGAVPGARGAGLPPAGGPGSAAGDQGLPTGARPVDAETAAAYQRATAEYRDYKQTYASGATGEVLRAGRGGELYALQNSEVPSRFWNSAESVQSFMRAAGHDDVAVAALEDYIGFDLRRAAEVRDANGRGTGQLNRAAYAKWMARNRDKIAALPEQVRQPLLDRFGAAERAQQTLDDLTAQRALLEKAYPIKPGGTDAELAAKYWVAGDKGAERVQQFARETGALGQADAAGPIRAYHGSPNDFAPEPGAPLGRFSDEKIGTGNILQEQGEGHYFTTTPELARIWGNVNDARPRVYEANLNVSPERLISWDKPLAAQPPEVRRILETFVSGSPRKPVGQLDEIRNIAGADGNSGSPEQLLQAGIHGVTFGTGREKSYVVFDPKRIEIIGKDGVPAPAQPSTQMANLADYAASRLRAEAVNPDGTLDVRKYEAWKQRYNSALSQLPADARARFETAAQAQRTLDMYSAARADAVRAFEKSAARHYLGGQDPLRSIGSALASNNPTRTLGELVGLVGHDAAALNGLRRDFMDYMLRRVQSERPVGNLNLGDLEPSMRAIKPDAFQRFVREQAGPIRVLFGQDGLENLQAVGADLRRSNLSVAGSKLPGQSNTAQDLVHKLGKGDYSILGTIIASEVGALGGEYLGFLAQGTGATMLAAGAASSIGYALLQSLRNAGLNRVDQLVTEAVLHPEFMQSLLTRAPRDPGAPIVKRLLGQIANLGTQASVTSQTRRPEARPPPPSRFRLTPPGFPSPRVP